MKIEDLEVAVRAQTEAHDARGVLDGSTKSYDYSVYHTYDEVSNQTWNVYISNFMYVSDL